MRYERVSKAPLLWLKLLETCCELECRLSGWNLPTRRLSCRSPEAAMPALFTCEPKSPITPLHQQCEACASSNGSNQPCELSSIALIAPFWKTYAYQHINARGYTLSQCLDIPGLQAIPLSITARSQHQQIGPNLRDAHLVSRLPDSTVVQIASRRRAMAHQEYFHLRCTCLPALLGNLQRAADRLNPSHIGSNPCGIYHYPGQFVKLHQQHEEGASQHQPSKSYCAQRNRAVRVLYIAAEVAYTGRHV